MGRRAWSYVRKALLLRAEDLGLQAEGVEPSEGGGVRPSGVEGVSFGDKLARATEWAWVTSLRGRRRGLWRQAGGGVLKKSKSFGCIAEKQYFCTQ